MCTGCLEINKGILIVSKLFNISVKLIHTDFIKLFMDTEELGVNKDS